MTEEDIRQQSYNDELIKLRLSNISLNARPKVERRVPVKQIVTQQQIDDYRRKLNKPVKVEGVNYKYSTPDSEPILEQVDDTVIEKVLSESDIEDGRKLIKKYVEERNKYMAYMDEMGQKKKDLIYGLNNNPLYIEDLEKIKKLKQEEKDIEKEMNKLVNTKRKNRGSISGIFKYKDEYDKLDIKLNEIKNKIVDAGIYNENDEENLNKKIKEIDELIDDIKIAIKDKESDIEYIQQEIRNNEQNKSINQAEEQRVKEINKGRVKNYQNELNQLNRGEFSIVQQGNETEQEWLERLGEFGETLYDDDKLNLESNIYNVKELRKNLKELIKDDVIIDDVIRAFNVVEEDVYQLNTIFNPYIKNKFIKLYGKFNPRITFDNVYNLLSDLLYQGKHGLKKENNGIDESDDGVEIKKSNLDNSTKNDEDNINTSSSNETTPQLEYKVGSLLSKVGSMLSDQLTGKPLNLEYESTNEEYNQPNEDYNQPNEEEQQPNEKELYNTEKLKIATYDNSFMIYNRENEKVLFLKLSSNLNSILLAYDNDGKGEIRDSNDAKGRYRLYGGRDGISFNGKTFIKWLSEKTNVYSVKTDEKKGIENDTDIILKYFGGSGTLTKITKYLKEEYGMTNTQQKIIKDSSGKNIKKNDGTDLMGFGLGLPKDIPKELIPFGRCKLHLYKLYYDNEFVLKDSSGFNIPGLRNVKVSDEFVELIMKIHNKENISQSFIKKLSKAEQDLYDLVIFKCGLKNLDIDHKTNVKNLKEKLATIEGEIEAGNDNKEVLKELYDVLQQLVIYKSINVSEAKKHYNSIKNDFF
jgi:hypothetical protein